MNQHGSRRLAVGIVAMTVTLLCASGSLRAQAFTPAQGEGTVSVQFQDAFVKYHQLPTVRLDRGHISGKTLLVDFTFGITDQLAVSVSLPWVASKYQRIPSASASHRRRVVSLDFSGPAIRHPLQHFQKGPRRYPVRWDNPAQPRLRILRSLRRRTECP